MMRRLLPVLLLGSLGLNVGLLLDRFGGQEALPERNGAQTQTCGWGNRALSEHLELEPHQTQKLEEARLEMLSRLEPLQEALRTKRHDLYRAFDRAVPDAGLMDLLVADIARLQGDIERVVIGHALRVRSLFAPGQEAKYRDLLGHVLCPVLSGQSLPDRGRAPGPDGCGMSAPCGNMNQSHTKKPFKEDETR